MSQQAVLVERTSARLGGMHFAPRVCSRTSACPITYRSARCGGICAVGNLTAIDRRTEGRVPLRMMCQSRAMTRRNPRNPRRARRSAQRKTLAAVSVTYSQEMPCEADRRSRESSAPAAAPPPRAPRRLRPPRCLPAWSQVQHQPAFPRAPRRLRPPRCSPAWSHVQHQPACPRAPRRLWPPRCSPAWSHVQHQPACARAPRRLWPPRCSPAWSHVQHQPALLWLIRKVRYPMVNSADSSCADRSSAG